MITRKETLKGMVTYGAEDIDRFVVTPFFHFINAVDAFLINYDDQIQYAAGHVIHGFLYAPLCIAQMICDDGEAEENWPIAEAITEICEKVVYDDFSAEKEIIVEAIETAKEETKRVARREFNRFVYACGYSLRTFLNDVEMVKSYVLWSFSDNTEVTRNSASYVLISSVEL